MHTFLSYIGQRLLIGLSLCYLVLLFIGQPAYACGEWTAEEERILLVFQYGFASLVALQIISIAWLAIKYFQANRWKWVLLSVVVSVLTYFVALGTMIGLDRMTTTETLSTPALLSIGFIITILTSMLAYKLLLNLYKHQVLAKLALKPIAVS